MRLLDFLFGWLRGRGRGNRRPGMVQPRGWLRRHWLASALVVAVLAAVPFAWWQPWRQPPPCGPGLTAVSSSNTCVGLDLEARGFGDDRVADLVAGLAAKNPARAAKVGTIVLLDDMTPDTARDTGKLQTLRHRIQGAMTAVWRADERGFAGDLPKLRLLLASYGSNAQRWSDAVEEIKKARAGENIVAVIGFGQSRAETRLAAAALSEAKIAVIGSIVTSDTMNVDLQNKPIQRFARVAPLNSQEARAGFSFMTASHQYDKVMLVYDENPKDDYSTTLANAFRAAYKEQYQQDVQYTEPYRSPDELVEVRREEYMAQLFARMHGDLCKIKPDLVYFAGRGADLKSFVDAMFDSGACGLGELDIVTGDSASFLIGEELPTADHLTVNIYYTAMAYADQWAEAAATSDAPEIVRTNAANYQDFEESFTSGQAYQFDRADLVDGHAIMSHDAVLAAVAVVRINPSSIPELSTVADQFPLFRCGKSAIPGASGAIAFDDLGNPVNKPMPILRVGSAEGKGSVTQVGLAWPLGAPSDPSTGCK